MMDLSMNAAERISVPLRVWHTFQFLSVQDNLWSVNVSIPCLDVMLTL